MTIDTDWDRVTNCFVQPFERRKTATALSDIPCCSASVARRSRGLMSETCDVLATRSMRPGFSRIFWPFFVLRHKSARDVEGNKRMRMRTRIGSL